MGATSAVPAISRHECIESIGLPTSTVGMPTRAALIGPIERVQSEWYRYLMELQRLH